MYIRLIAFQIGFVALVYGTLLYIGSDWMTIVSVMLILVVAGSIVIWVAWLQEKERRSAARELGLEVSGSNIHGSIDGFIIFVGPVFRGESRVYQYRIMLSEECSTWRAASRTQRSIRHRRRKRISTGGCMIIWISPGLQRR